MTETINRILNSGPLSVESIAVGGVGIVVGLYLIWLSVKEFRKWNPPRKGVKKL